jgi:hypothetical protein
MGHGAWRREWGMGHGGGSGALKMGCAVGVWVPLAFWWKKYVLLMTLSQGEPEKAWCRCWWLAGFQYNTCCNHRMNVRV